MFQDLRTELGAWFDDSLLLDHGSRLQLYARAAWANDSGNNGSAMAFFQSLPRASFIANGAKPDNNSALVTVGAKYALANGWSVMASFDGEFSGNTTIYGGTGIIRKTR
jgi:outer membrane autotransporter protein